MSHSSGPTPRPRLNGAERAAWLINVHYTKLYGREIRYESPRTLRLKIQELEASIRAHQQRGCHVYVAMVRTAVDYERIAELMEMLPQ